MSAPSDDAPDHCAVCGEAIPPRARACPGCGADERTGWREQSIYDGLDLPGEETESSARTRSRSSTGLRWSTWVILVALAVILVLGALGLS